MKIKLAIAALILSSVIFLPSAAMTFETTQVSSTTTFADSYYRTELYFGRSIPGGGMVTEDEWDKFLAEVVTPRFPDGFTILKATGQYREANGTIDREPSEVLLFFYPARKRTASRRKIEEIRSAYVKKFRQESVLRFDYPSTVRVSF